MQLIIQYSKYLFLAVLSSSLLISWYSYETDAMHLTTSSYYIDEDVRASRSIWETMTNQFALDTKSSTPQVRAEIKKILADKKHFNEILKSASPYIYYIHKEISARGLPVELALIPIIESEYNPYDISHKGASGLWQLMKTTAHELGVKVKSDYDGRRNVIASTKAAVLFIMFMFILMVGIMAGMITIHRQARILLSKIRLLGFISKTEKGL